MSIKALPSMEHTFTVDIKGSDTGQQYAGTFTYKRPNIRAKSEIAKMKARLNESLGVDSDTDFIHEMLAYLRYTLIASDNSQWWVAADHGYNLFDLNVIMDIYKEVKKWDAAWMDKVWVADEKKASLTS